jgi:signal transduction histidine kinase
VQGTGRPPILSPAVLLILCLAGLLAFELWRSYRVAREDAERSVQNLTQLLAEQTARTLQSVDLTLQDIVTDIENDPAISDNDAAFRARLTTRLREMPYVRALFVIGADGFIIHDTDYPSTPHVSLADRAYFSAHRDNPSLGLYVGHPLRSRSVDVWFIGLSRRIEKPGSGFSGVAVAAVEPLYFENFYRRMLVGDGTIALFLDDDATLLARAPRNDDVMGKSFASADLFQSLRSSRQGFIWSASPIDGVRRLAGFQLLDGFPVVTLVTLNQSDLMRSWRSHAVALGVGAMILMVLLLAFEWLSRRYRRREDYARKRLEEATRLETVGRLAAWVAHDIGNVTRIVRSAVLLLRPMTADKPEAARLLDEIDLSLTSGRELVNQLLAYSDRREMRPQRADVGTLVMSLLPVLRRAAGPNIEIKFEQDGTNNVCLIDPVQFQAAMVNLVLNSRDAMPAGGMITIGMRIIDSDTDGRWTQINVHDDGQGMSQGVLAQAFEPFFTTKSPDKGSGLGLGQVLDFVNRSGGQVVASSTEGVGTTMSMRFPGNDTCEKESTSAL